MMTNGDPEGPIFYSNLARLMDFFLLNIKCRIFMFEKRLAKVPNYAVMRHDMMTSL